VPRYYFHFSDGQRQFSDGIGCELSGLAAARVHAGRQIRDLKIAMCDPYIQDVSGWTMIVADASGRTVFETQFDSKRMRSEV
jgi:hypothetical protein